MTGASIRPGACRRLRGPRRAPSASPAGGSASSPPRPRPSIGALIGIFVLAWIVVTINGGEFLTVPNIVNMLQRSVALGIVAVGQTVVILLGSLDLSVAYADQRSPRC